MTQTHTKPHQSERDMLTAWDRFTELFARDRSQATQLAAQTLALWNEAARSPLPKPVEVKKELKKRK